MDLMAFCARPDTTHAATYTPSAPGKNPVVCPTFSAYIAQLPSHETKSKMAVASGQTSNDFVWLLRHSRPF